VNIGKEQLVGAEKGVVFCWGGKKGTSASEKKKKGDVPGAQKKGWEGST